MVDTALDLPRCPFSNPLTLKQLQIKEKKFLLFEVFLDEKITFLVDFDHQNLRWPISL